MLSDFVSFDLETTGLQPASCRVIEIAAVRWSRGKIVGRFQSLVNPGEPIHPDSIAIHGITDADVTGAPDFAAAFALFSQFSGEHTLVAHNAGFDLSFLAAECSRLGRPFAPGRVLDTLNYARTAFPLFKSYRLESLVGALSLGADTFHRALADAESAGRLLLAAMGTGVAAPRRAWIEPVEPVSAVQAPLIAAV